MNLIACVDSNWAISNKGEILVSIPADKKLFKELTDGKVVVGGGEHIGDLVAAQLADRLLAGAGKGDSLTEQLALPRKHGGGIDRLCGGL